TNSPNLIAITNLLSSISEDVSICQVDSALVSMHHPYNIRRKGTFQEYECPSSGLGSWSKRYRSERERFFLAPKVLSPGGRAWWVVVQSFVTTSERNAPTIHQAAVTISVSNGIHLLSRQTSPI